MIEQIKDVWKEFFEWLNTPEEEKQKKREKIKRRIKVFLDKDNEEEKNYLKLDH